MAIIGSHTYDYRFVTPGHDSVVVIHYIFGKRNRKSFNCWCSESEFNLIKTDFICLVLHISFWKFWRSCIAFSTALRTKIPSNCSAIAVSAAFCHNFERFVLQRSEKRFKFILKEAGSSLLLSLCPLNLDFYCSILLLWISYVLNYFLYVFLHEISLTLIRNTVRISYSSKHLFFLLFSWSPPRLMVLTWKHNFILPISKDPLAP